MSRYKSTQIRNDYKNGRKKSYYTTTYIPGRMVTDSDMYFIAQEGDRCDNLAVRFYNDHKFWWYIAHINNLTTMNIPAGTSLRIPSSISMQNSTNY